MARRTDAEVVLHMLDAAYLHGIVFDVVATYVRYMRSGNSVREAAWSALYDWDV